MQIQLKIKTFFVVFRSGTHIRETAPHALLYTNVSANTFEKSTSSFPLALEQMKPFYVPCSSYAIIRHTLSVIMVKALSDVL